MTLTIYAPDGDISSYGIMACELARALTRQGMAINVLTPEGQYPAWEHDRELQMILHRDPIVQAGGLLMCYPTHFYRYGPLANMGLRVAITMFESTKLPDGWVEGLNKMAAVIVPSVWVRDVFLREGVTSPVVVSPLGIADAFEYKPRQVDGPFTFVTIGDRGNRKNTQAVIEAFRLAFADRDDVQLIIKMRDDPKDAIFTYRDMPKQFHDLPHQQLVQMLAQTPLTSLPSNLREAVEHNKHIKILPIADENITLLRDDLSMSGMAELYQAADVGIWMGVEGFGLGAREMAATGGLSLALNWAGQSDDIHQWGLPFERYQYKMAWPHHRQFEGLGLWAVPEIEPLAAALLAIINMDVDTRNEMGAAFSAWVHDNYSWERHANEVLHVYNNVQQFHGRLTKVSSGNGCTTRTG